ncbi:MAG TPA: phosphate ABC transporter permease PstA [Dehalococcoidia bacterium]|nr:phosphate ABC transporter permease PstA [Dehalococcoidia bacterium]
MRLSPPVTQKMAWAACWAAAFFAIAALLTIIIYVFARGVGEIGWAFLSTDPIGGLSGQGGIRSAIVGTIYIVVLTLAMAAPLGIGAGIYLAEYAGDNWFTRIVRWVIETLAGVPSIVFGLFGFALFVIALNLSFCILAGALTLACLVLPTIIRTTEEAIKAVPQGHREGSLALGATKWQTIRHVVLPAAMPGIVTAIILAIGRSVEETACLYVTMGGSANMPITPLDNGRTLSLHLFYLAMNTNAMEKALATGVMLIIIIVIINAITRWLSSRWMIRMQGRV